MSEYFVLPKSSTNIAHIGVVRDQSTVRYLAGGIHTEDAFREIRSERQLWL